MNFWPNFTILYIVIVFNINDIKNKLIMDDKLIIFEVKRMLGELISTKCSVLSESQKETIIDNTTEYRMAAWSSEDR